MELFDLPVEVYNTLVRYLPDESVARLSQVQRATLAKTTMFTDNDYYWLGKIEDILSIQGLAIPSGISPKDLYNDVKKAHNKDLIRRYLHGKTTSELKWTLLEYACKYQLPTIITMLLNDSSCYLSSLEKRILGNSAAREGRTITLQILLADHRFRIHRNLHDMLSAAIDNGSTTGVRELLAILSIDPSIDNNDYLRSAVDKGLYNIARLLLNDNRVLSKAGKLRKFFSEEADRKDERELPIAKSAKEGDTPVVRALLETNDPSVYDDLPLRLAADKGHTDVVKLLLSDPRVDPTSRQSKALWIAASNGHVEVVSLLLDDGRADPSAADNRAIRLASQHGHIEVVRLLLDDNRVDPSALDNYAIISDCRKQSP